MRQIFRKVLKNDSGLTLTELLIYLVITAFLSLGISRLITDSAAGLDRASQESVAARQVIRFSNTLKYDISGATTVNTFGSTLLLTDPVCQSTGFKPLFTVVIKILNPLKQPQPDGTNAYEPSPLIYWATYGFHQDTSATGSKLFLSRSFCSHIAAINFENLLDLGNESIPTLTGQDFLSKSPKNTYTFQLPNSLKIFTSNKGFSTLRNLTTQGKIDLVQTLASKVDEA